MPTCETTVWTSAELIRMDPDSRGVRRGGSLSLFASAASSSFHAGSCVLAGSLHLCVRVWYCINVCAKFGK